MRECAAQKSPCAPRSPLRSQTRVAAWLAISGGANCTSPFGHSSPEDDERLTSEVVAQQIPVADATVRDGASTSTNFGNVESLVVKSTGTVNSGYNRWSYLRFDLSAVSGAINAVKVWQAHTDPTPEAYAGGYLLAHTAGGNQERVLQAWKPNAPPVTIEIERAQAATQIGEGDGPQTIEALRPAGESCESRRCLVIADSLYLIP